MRFELESGLSSLQGKRPRNEDFAGVQAPAAHEAERGWVAALADGVSGGGSGDGLMAAQTSVMSLLRDFHAEGLGWFAYVEMLSFMLTLALGLVYVWRKGALEWS